MLTEQLKEFFSLKLEKTYNKLTDNDNNRDYVLTPVPRAPIDPVCQCTDCATKGCIDQIVDHHRLDEDSFFALVIEYYRRAGISPMYIPDPLEMTKLEVEALIAGIDCSHNCIMCDIDATHPDKHTGMRLSIHPSCPPPSVGIYYSIALFKGLLAMTPTPTKFAFVRLVDKRLTTSSMGVSAMVDNTVIYYGELSSDF